MAIIDVHTDELMSDRNVHIGKPDRRIEQNYIYETVHD